MVRDEATRRDIIIFLVKLFPLLVVLLLLLLEPADGVSAVGFGVGDVDNCLFMY